MAERRRLVAPWLRQAVALLWALTVELRALRAELSPAAAWRRVADRPLLRLLHDGATHGMLERLVKALSVNLVCS